MDISSTFSDASKLPEEQYIIRFPENVGERVRKMIQNGELSNDQISFHFPEHSRVGKLEILDTYNDTKVKFKVTLCDLPCVVESHRTEDNRVYYKSGDIGQILLVQEDEEMGEKEMNDYFNGNNNNNNNNNIFNNYNNDLNDNNIKHNNNNNNNKNNNNNHNNNNNNIHPIYDAHFNIYDGLTPPTKNIRKRKFRHRIKYSAEDMKEAQTEILRFKSGK